MALYAAISDGVRKEIKYLYTPVNNVRKCIPSLKAGVNNTRKEILTPLTEFDHIVWKIDDIAAYEVKDTSAADDDWEFGNLIASAKAGSMKNYSTYIIFNYTTSQSTDCKIEIVPKTAYQIIEVTAHIYVKFKNGELMYISQFGNILQQYAANSSTVDVTVLADPYTGGKVSWVSWHPFILGTTFSNSHDYDNRTLTIPTNSSYKFYSQAGIAGFAAKTGGRGMQRIRLSNFKIDGTIRNIEIINPFTA